MRRVTTLLPLTLLAACYTGVEQSPYITVGHAPDEPGETSGDVDHDGTSSSGGDEGTSSGADPASTGESVDPQGADKLSLCEVCGCFLWSTAVDPTPGEVLQVPGGDPAGVTLVALPDGGVLLASTTEAGLTLHRFTATGAAQWSRTFPGELANVRAAPLGDDFVVVAGTLTGSLTLKPDLPSGTLHTKGGADGFVALLAEAGEGEMVWGANFGDAADQVVSDLAATDCDGGLANDCRLQLVGTHAGELGLGPSAPGESVFHARLPAIYWKPSEATVWRAPTMLTPDVGVPSLATAPDSAVTLVGTVRDANDLGDIVVHQLGADGQESWDLRLTAPGQQRATSATHAGDNLWIAGEVHARTDLGAGPFGADGQETSFIAALAADGAIVNSRAMGGRLPAQQALTSVRHDAILVTGYTNRNVDLGGGMLEFRGGRDVMLARYRSTGEYLCGALYGDVALQEGLAAASAGDRTFVLSRVQGSIDFGRDWQTSESEQLVLAAFWH